MMLRYCLLLATLSMATPMEDPTTDGDVQFGGLQGHKPGLKLRITQAVSDLVKDNLLQYGMAYLNFDLKIPEHGIYHISSFPLYTDVHYSNLVSDPFKLDIERAALNYTHMIVDEAAVVYLELPVVKHWRIAFDYVYSYILTFDGRFEFDFRDLSAIVTSELRATHDGHLYPHLHDLKINIVHSTLYHEDAFAEFMYRQFFNLGKYILQNAYNLFGASIINQNLFSMSKLALGDQIFHFPMDIPQLNKTGDFNVNWRMTADPKIHNHELDFSLFFDVGPESHHCLMQADTHDYFFQDNYKNKYVQFVVSDRVPNCLFEAMERQHWFTYKVDTQFMVNHFGTHKIPINAALLKKTHPRIAEKYGDDQELELELEFRHPRVHFGKTERNMDGVVTLKFGIRQLENLNYIAYDEFDIKFEADIAIDQEVLVGNVASFTIVKSEHTDTERTTPIYDTLGTTAEEYATFWSGMAKRQARYQGILNKVLSTGIPLPYWNLSFLTEFTFHPHAMLIVMDVFYNSMDLIVKPAPA